jgi:hypothetical protein
MDKKSKSDKRSKSDKQSKSRSASLSRSNSNPSKINEWHKRNSLCPKMPIHQLTVNKEGDNWIKITNKDIVEKSGKFIIKKLNRLPGVYIVIILKEYPKTIFLLREFADLYFNQQIVYPEAPLDLGMIGHSSIYSNNEFKIEWLKESVARENELLASKSKDKKTKRKHLRIARKTREQCLLYFAGQLFYDKEIVVWNNHSGHFQPNKKVKNKVGLPLEKFEPMGSKNINKLIDERYS